MPATPRRASTPSTRQITKDTGRFTRSTAGSRSLERGLELLRAFRPGTSALTNAELARRTGLARPTVSRLTRSLVDAGFLCHEAASGGYRLAAVVLSLAYSFRYAAPELDAALPLMRRVADAEHVNVGLAVADGTEIVYLDSIRRERSRTHLPAPPGSRLPLELTAVGHAYLAAIPPAARAELFAAFAERHGATWPRLRAAIERARASCTQHGWCVAEWLPGLPVVATVIRAPDGSLRMLNLGFSASHAERQRLAQRYAPVLMKLASDMREAWQPFTDADAALTRSSRPRLSPRR